MNIDEQLAKKLREELEERFPGGVFPILSIEKIGDKRYKVVHAFARSCMDLYEIDIDGNKLEFERYKTADIIYIMESIKRGILCKNL